MELEEKYKYNANYQKENIRRIIVKLNRKTERDQKILNFLDTQRNIQGYIKDLIEADMNK